MKMNHLAIRILMIFAIVAFISLKGYGQAGMPEVLDKGTIVEQMKYLEEKTRIYENYRAIREDMFQKIKNNSTDSLSSAKNRIAGLMNITRDLNSRIDSLNKSLADTREELSEMTKTKDSIKVIGLEFNKTLYNTIMWTIAGALALLLIIGFLAFKRNLSVTSNTKKDFAELKAEFEEYRKKTRLEREKMSMDHFNEMKRLKGKA